MKVLIAEDDPVSSRILERHLKKWGYEIVSTSDGEAALQALCATDAPQLAILDWMMPRIDGRDLCRLVREKTERAVYLILLTTKGETSDIVSALGAGADDYVTKPFDPDELHARVKSGERVLTLQNQLALKVAQLEEALSSVKRLQGLLPICSYCRKVRDDKNYWHQVEVYVTDHSEARFTHGICPHCLETIVKPELERARQVKE